VDALTSTTTKCARKKTNHCETLLIGCDLSLRKADFAQNFVFLLTILLTNPVCVPQQCLWMSFVAILQLANEHDICSLQSGQTRLGQFILTLNVHCQQIFVMSEHFQAQDDLHCGPEGFDIYEAIGMIVCQRQI